MDNLIVTRPRSGILLVQLNRPKSLNALNKPIFADLAAVLGRAEADEDVRCVVLTGNERAFSAGSDIKEMPEGPMPPFVDPLRISHWKTVENFGKPLIAAVNGYALGGGCELMLMCDLVIAGENAKIGTPEINIGAFPGGGGTQRLPRTIGKARTMKLVLTGEPIDARTACEWGLVVEVVPIDRTVSRCLEIAETIASKSPLAARLAKEDVLMSYQKPLDVSASLERKMLLWQSRDHDEGIMAFVEKRSPKYTGV